MHAAAESVRLNRLGVDVLAFTTIRSASLQIKQLDLEREGATDTEKLNAANARINALEADLRSAKDVESFLLEEQKLTEDRAQSAEAQLTAASYRTRQLREQLKQRGQKPDADIPLPESWPDFGDWCDQNLVGRVVLAPQARTGVRNPIFEDPQLAARCLVWLANDYRGRRLEAGDGSLRDYVLEPGVKNVPCGADEFRFSWRGDWYTADWHIKNEIRGIHGGACASIITGTSPRSWLSLLICRGIGTQAPARLLARRAPRRRFGRTSEPRRINQIKSYSPLIPTGIL
jgi:hypothetical protein